MVYLNLDENNYLLSVATVGGGIEAEINLADYDLSGNKIRAHKWENETLTFDADRYAEIHQEEIETTPITMEQLRADIDYIAVMTGVEL